jgi:hypothetical protein
MSVRETIEAIFKDRAATSRLDLSPDMVFEVSGRSAHRVEDGVLLLARHGAQRRLVVADLDRSGITERFAGHRLEPEPGVTVRVGELDHDNAVALRDACNFANPRPLGLDDSFGLGDRLGIAGPAHLRALRDSGFKVVLAQQSIRELERTERTPEEVMDAAVWAVIEEGWEEPWGADADHLKTEADIELMAGAGFTMFTIDPGDHVVDAADTVSLEDLQLEASALPWADLEDSLASALRRYAGGAIQVGPDLELQPSNEEILRGWVKYGASLAHAARMYRHIAETMGSRPFEVEVSVDETAAVTTPFEHYLVASELRRLGVEWVGLAPRFVGDFEKGIDYRGDLEVFRTEYLKHLAIAEALGPYKISIHSGSDKFGVYRVIDKIGRGGVHVKTAGTSYLEALRTLASCEPELFREILDFSRSLYEHERRTYHVSAELERVPAASELDDDALPRLFDDDDTRQVLHVTFGRVLTDKGSDGEFIFKNRLLDALARHEAAHYDNLVAHFRRHTAPFGADGES